MKKKSFFERLAGNLRFDDKEDDIPQEKHQHEHVEHTEKRDLPIKGQHTPTAVLEPEEEIGELPVDMYETGNELVIQTLIAGVLPEHLSISITRDTVSIYGKREANKSVTPDQYHTQELYWGSFARKVLLPVEVEIDTAEAIERHGMLMIRLPKTDKGRKTVLKIKSI